MQTDWQSLSSIKTSEVARMAASVVTLKAALQDYARDHNGTFFIFGSVAKGNLRYNSDVDVLVDFPKGSISEAWRFCEDTCRQQGLTPDIRPKNLCSPKFLEKALLGAVELSGERRSLARN
jgi:predicted nucleotidyltransferase